MKKYSVDGQAMHIGMPQNMSQLVQKQSKKLNEVIKTLAQVFIPD
jgi:hypothetical protein